MDSMVHELHSLPSRRSGIPVAASALTAFSAAALVGKVTAQRVCKLQFLCTTLVGIAAYHDLQLLCPLCATLFSRTFRLLAHCYLVHTTVDDLCIDPFLRHCLVMLFTPINYKSITQLVPSTKHCGFITPAARLTHMWCILS